MLTIGIIIIIVLTSISAFNNETLFHKMKFAPYIIREASSEIHRFLAYGFIHANWIHLIINMLVLYMFGMDVEKAFATVFPGYGRLLFLGMFVLAIVISVIPSYLKHRSNPSYSAVGASGAVSAVVFSYVLFFPSSTLMLLLIPIPIPAPVFAIIYLVYSAIMAKKNIDNIGHDAHFYGAVFGLVFTIVAKPIIGKLFIIKIMDLLPF